MKKVLSLIIALVMAATMCFTASAMHSLDRFDVNANDLPSMGNLAREDVINIQPGDRMYILGWAVSYDANLSEVVYTINGEERQCDSNYRDRPELANALGIPRELTYSAGIGCDDNAFELTGIEELPAGMYRMAIIAKFTDGSYEFIKDEFDLIVGNADDFMNICVYGDECMAGKTVTVKVRLERCPGIMSLCADLKWNKNLTLISAKYNVYNKDDETALVHEAEDWTEVGNSYRFSWVTNDTNFKVEGDCDFLTLKFKLNKNFKNYRNLPISIQVDPDNVYCYDPEQDADVNVPFAVFDGSVWAYPDPSVRDFGEINPDVLNIVVDGGLGKNEAEPGDYVDVYINLVNVQSISSLRLVTRWGWDAEFIEGEYLIGGEEGRTLYNDFEQQEENTIVLNWVTIGAPVTEDTAFARLRFRINDYVRDKDFIPVNISAEDEDVFTGLGELIPYQTISGGIDAVRIIVGDVDENERINNSDVILLFRCLNDMSDFEYRFKAADCNMDGAVNNKDVVTLFEMSSAYYR